MNYPEGFIRYSASLKKLTSLRKSVLFILWKLAKPLKAYELLDELKSLHIESQPAAVYRVLDYFISQGIAHKIESIQAFTLCCTPTEHLPSEIIMLCEHCHSVQERFDSKLLRLIQELASENSFHLGQDTIELRGACQVCYKNNYN